MTNEKIDLGHDRELLFIGWHPDRTLNPQYEGIEDVEKYMAIITHKKPDGSLCDGAIRFDSPAARALGQAPLWTVESWEPLTISPSLLCHCGDHGFIRNGQWVPA